MTITIRGTSVTAGRGRLGRVVLGGVAEQVFRRARGPVALFHPGRTP